MFKAKQKIIFFSLLALAVGLLVLPQAALAQASLGLELGADTGLGTRDLKDLIVTVIRVLLGFLGIICVGGIMYGGYLLMTAGGNEEKNSQGKKVAVNATIGLAVILSAFLIVSFVFNLFSDVTGGGGSGQGDRGAGDGGLGGGGDAAFRVTGIQPRGQLSIRNIVAQVTFSQNINPALIGEDRALTNQNAIVVEKQNEAGNFEPVEGVLKISANNPKKVLFVPNSACPEPHQDLKCFSYDENNASLNRHRIRVRSEAEVAIRSVSNLAVSCLGNSCQAEFATGANIDLEAPTVNLTEAINRFNEHLALRNGLPFIIDEAYQLLALATDDSGVAGIDFYVNEEFLDSQLPDNDPPREFLGQVDWSTQGLAPGRYVLAARSYDLTDRQSELSQVRVVVRPVHCFNNRQDEDLGETGLDCGGVCGACPGDLCGPVEENVCREPNNELCASGVCSAQNCRCLTAPVITQISPEAGAVGNFITIFGRNFGNTEGQVLIGDVRANLPHNNFCNGSWQDEQLIVELPQGLAVGNRQVRVITSDNLRSNNYDFSVNEETRPSLCLAVPVYGVVGGGFNLLGKNFGNQEQERSVYFGNGENFPAAEQAWNQLGNGIERASGLVPNIREGQTTVRVQLAGRSSNSLRFTVLLPNALLRLIDFNPKIGQAGQYVKISGQGFGDYQAQVSKVFFSGSVEGSFDFPQECLADNNFWTDSEILVKVPEGAQDGPLTVVVGERRVQSEVDFDYNSEAGLAPGLCSLHPQEGRVGSTFDLAGEYFTDATVKLGEQELVDQPFDDRHFNAVTVPEGARSGPVTVVRGDLQSNGLDFIVLQGRTMPPALPRDYYQWQFTTCDDCLVPEVVESATCGQDLASPSPVKNSRNAFRDTVISATFNVDMNNDLFQANQTVLLESCGQENSPAANCQAVNFAGQFAFGHTGGNSEYFTLILNDNLNLNTWYKVTLRDLRSTRENLALAEPYIWKFKTRVEDARCQIDQVRVTPNQKTLQNNDPVYLGERVNYRAQGFNAQNCNICPDRFSWAWSSSDQNNATIDDRSRIAQSLLVASGVTRQTATITATGSNNQGQSQAGTASVDIVPPRPRLIFEEQCSENLQSPSPYPGRQNACLNGKIAVRFSQVMSESLLNPAILTLSELPSLNQVDLNLDRGIYYEEGGQNGLRGAIFTPESNLRPNTWYEVSLTPEDIASLDGSTLTGLSRWQFKTRNSREACAFNQVSLNPARAVILKQQRQNYSALTLDSQTCQILSEPADLNWSWQSENQTVATVDESRSSTNTATAQDQEGETFIRASALGITNSGINGRLRVTSQVGPEDTSLRIMQNGPTGENSCVNSLARVRFNFGLNPATVNRDNLFVSKYNNSDCSGGCPVALNLSKNLTNTVVELMPQADNHLWASGFRYKVSLRGGVKRQGEAVNYRLATADEEPLLAAGCSNEGEGTAGLTWDEQNQICSWEFSIPANGQSCPVAGIHLEPPAATISQGQIQGWGATVIAQDNTFLSDPVESWRSSNEAVANVTVQENSHFAVSQGSGIGQTNIIAKIGAKEGQAVLKVNELLTGPAIISVKPDPDSENVCRNALIKVVFSKPLNNQTVNQQTVKAEYGVESQNELPGCRQEVARQGGGNLLSKTLIGRLFNFWTANFWENIFNSLVNKAQATVYWCPIKGTWTQEISLGLSELRLALEEALPARAVIKVTVIGGEQGVKGANGLPLIGQFNQEGNYVYQFGTSADVCSLSFVKVTADQVTGQSDWTFNTSVNNPTDDNPANGNFDSVKDRDKKYLASGFATNGAELQSVSGVYEWAWQWQTEKSEIAQLLFSNGHLAVVGAQNKNGQSKISAAAVFPSSYQQKSLAARGLAIVDICENPWNPIGDGNPVYRFADLNFNFSFKYCRDEGSSGFSDDLPALELPEMVTVDEPTGGRGLRGTGGATDDGLLREYLMKVPTTGDVIGLRIYSNLSHLSPIDWYQKNIEVKGRPVNSQVDGYEAIEDGRTVYVAAANVEPIRRDGFSYFSKQPRLASRINSFLTGLWRGIKNSFYQPVINKLQASAGNNFLVGFHGQLTVMQNLNQRFNTQRIEVRELDDLAEQVEQFDATLAGLNLDNLSAEQLNELYAEFNVNNRQELISALESLSATVDGLRADLARYQGLVVSNSSLEQFADRLNNLQVQSAQAQEFLNQFTSFNEGITSGLNRDQLGDFSDQSTRLTALQEALTEALNINDPVFDIDVFAAVNLGYQVTGVSSGYTNIYLLSYNQSVNPKTQEILNRLMDNLRFNSNVDNPAVKAKVQRDVKRLADLGKMSASLENYRRTHNGQYPSLSAGTFIKGLTISKWPSWQKTLSSELGVSLPLDPLNSFSSCVGCIEPSLNNAGFEQGQTGWQLVRPEGTEVSLTENTSFVKEASKSLGINSSASGGGVSQGLDLLTNTTYELSAWVYVESGQAHLTFWGDDYGNEWISPPDHHGWFELKNRLVTNPTRQSGPNTPDNGIFIRAHGGPARFYLDKVTVKTSGGNCGYNQETCWNPEANQGHGSFACGTDSSFYLYKNLNQNNYNLAARMESTANWLPANSLNAHWRLSNERIEECTTQALNAYCGDGSVRSPEQCEPGLSAALCAAEPNWYSPFIYGCQAPGQADQCQWSNPLTDPNSRCFNLSVVQCCGGYCGDNVLNTQAVGFSLAANEACDRSAPNNADGFGGGSSATDQYACSAVCQDIGGYCGDGSVQSDYGEQYDSDNPGGWACFSDRAASASYQNCRVVCASGNPYQGSCGNNQKEGPEICDGSSTPPNTACSQFCHNPICNTGFVACDNKITDDNGCEINLINDVNNCGFCGKTCPAPANGAAVCNNLICDFTCNQNFRREGNNCVEGNPT